MIRKTISLLLVLSAVFSCILHAFAAPASSTEICSGTTKVAYLSNINSDGSNIGTDTTNPQSITNDYDVSFSLTDSVLSLCGIIKGNAFAVSGSIVTTNENRNLLLYEAEDTLNNHEVAYMAVERELNETALFFDAFHNANPTLTNVIKLYMQPINSNDLVFIEIFINQDFVLQFKHSSVIYDSTTANRLQSWFTSYYGPLSEADTPSPAYNVDPETVDLSKTYNIMGSTVTFRFVINLDADIPDVEIGDSSFVECSVNIVESRTVSDLDANNSSTQGYLELREVNIQFAPIPYMELLSQTPMRSGIRKNTGSIKLDFSVSLGYSLGPLSASGSLSFEPEDTLTMSTALVQLDDLAEPVRGTETGTLPSNYYLRDVNSYYGFHVNFIQTDTPYQSGIAQVVFEYYVRNAYDYTESFYDSYEGFYVINID